jgi:hypothetical protein
LGGHSRRHACNRLPGSYLMYISLQCVRGPLHVECNFMFIQFPSVKTYVKYVRYFCFVLPEEAPPPLTDILRILIFINYSVDDWKCSLFLVLNMSTYKNMYNVSVNNAKIYLYTKDSILSGRHVSTLTGSSSGPLRKTDPKLLCVNALWDHKCLHVQC